MTSLRAALEQFNFARAFVVGLGWNSPRRASIERRIGDRTLHFKPIAEMGGFVVLEVTEPSPVGLPSTPALEDITAPRCSGLRRAADTAITGEMHSHILIFLNTDRTASVWQLTTIRRKRLYRERRYYPGVPSQPLITMLKGFEIPWELLDDTGDVSHTEMLDRLEMSGAFAEKVTKRFYQQFEKQRKAFAPFLAWIEDERQRSWYVTALLNRLMFIYFVQQKGLLKTDIQRDETAYLRNRWEESRQRGKDRFYRDFFLPLCFFGFGKPQGERGPFEALFAAVPYLNGGLFLLHPVEKEMGISPEAILAGSLPPSVIIPDAEFGKWFTFFDDWRWTFDETDITNEGQISPAILGYIFEKYINQKQMGAYYTKEDITGYICKNTILPRLFDMLAATGKKGRQAVLPLPIGPHPNLLNEGRGISQGEGIDRYLYAAVKTTDYLPTETDREFDARQARYQHLLQDFDDGKITSVNDFITYNLDIAKMALDFVATIQDAEVLHAFYFQCVRKITVLDPTCGSGAFLFAALNLLFPLYEGCLRKMEALCAQSSGDTAPVANWKGEFAFVNEVSLQQSFLDPETATPEALGDFHAELARIREHPNPAYYIYKSIIVSNLFGVDIMEEAVEICKLRLFLKLIAHAEPDDSKPNQGIEPLPDIDFNILAGNTLVGFATRKEVDAHFRTDLPGFVWGAQFILDRLIPKLEQYALETLEGKADDALKQEIDGLKEAVTIELDKEEAAKRKITDLAGFRKTHQPFHWLVEFPKVTATGGFDAIVGNPPYVEYSKVRKDYKIIGFRTENAGNLYAYVTERSLEICQDNGWIGLVVQQPVVSTQRMKVVRDALDATSSMLLISTYDDRPSKLFDGMHHARIAIVMGRRSRTPCRTSLFVTSYQKWYKEERAYLFALLRYMPCPFHDKIGCYPKFGSDIEAGLILKMHSESGRFEQWLSRQPTDYRVYYKITGVGHWFTITIRRPRFRRQGTESSSSREETISFPDTASRDRAFVLLNSSLFYWFYQVRTNCRDFNPSDYRTFPTSASLNYEDMSLLATQLQTALDASSTMSSETNTLTGAIEVERFRPRMSKSIIDEIDRVLARHYGFTDEELDFIINYDIKYRMGKDTEESEE